jgi:hypothetical protein
MNHYFQVFLFELVFADRTLRGTAVAVFSAAVGREHYLSYKLLLFEPFHLKILFIRRIEVE